MNLPICSSKNLKGNSLPNGFVYLHKVDPTIKQKIEFGTINNCVGAILDGYDGTQAVCTYELALKLKETQENLKKEHPNYELFIMDTYRPIRAVKHLQRWAADPDDQKTKSEYYPDIEKSDLPGKYIAAGNSSHSRGSTVDLLILNSSTGEFLDFGASFFGDYCHYQYKGLTPSQQKNRMILRDLMLSHGFKPYDAEFWHFTLVDEPFPKTYFDFSVTNDLTSSLP